MPIFLSFSICSGVLDVLSFPFTIFCSPLTQLHSSLPSTMIPFLTLAPTPCSSKYLTASSYIISQCDIKLSRTVLGSSSLNISTLSSLNTPFWIKFLCWRIQSMIFIPLYSALGSSFSPLGSSRYSFTISYLASHFVIFALYIPDFSALKE